ncbi:Nucleotide-binding, alpha-beta plait [Artemisia annua]|uniref:Nucleotide-binding, alpha-beta plait n=1 Tax=Artemisia annua TaxID=35608 RepID=A0A2U1QCS0_ARTAN|nr:Nucleotide-binding, alpha-beta plait [Artemisia annua]
MGDYNDAFLRNNNAAVQARTKQQNRANLMQMKLVRLIDLLIDLVKVELYANLTVTIGQSHPTGLTNNLLKLFEPRPPLEYKPPPEKTKCLPYTGMAQFVSNFAEPADPEYAPPVVKGETPIGQSHPTGLTNNLLKLFEPRPPLEYKPPPEKTKCLPYTGMAQFVSNFAEPADPEYAPPVVKGETPGQKRARIHQLRLEEGARKAAEELEKYDPNNDPNISGDPYKTLFVARLNYETTESRIKREFEAYGPIKRVGFVEYLEKGLKVIAFCSNLGFGYLVAYSHHSASKVKRYFMLVAYSHHSASKVQGKRYFMLVAYSHHPASKVQAAYKQADGRKLDNRRVLVDVERGRTVPNWRPRRLGGGLGTTRVGGEEVNQRNSGSKKNSMMVREQPQSGGTARSVEPRATEERDRDREKSRERVKDREREKSRERSHDKPRDREHRDDRHRDRDRDRKSDRGDRDRDRRDRDRHRDRSERRDRSDRGRDRHREKDKDRDYESGDVEPMDRVRGRSRDKDYEYDRVERHGDRQKSYDPEEWYEQPEHGISKRADPGRDLGGYDYYEPDRDQDRYDHQDRDHDRYDQMDEDNYDPANLDPRDKDHEYRRSDRSLSREYHEY